MSPIHSRPSHRHRTSALASAVLLGGCSVQAGLNVPAPAVYVRAPVVSAEVAAPEGGIEITASEPPPPLPTYEQPPCPQEGFLWTPGNWRYASGGYFWVPGTWVDPPRAGVLWTPGYWGFGGGVYGFHAGYWGPHIGFYGGVNYGYGYGGSGFVGGRWNGGHFAYNTAVNNVNVSIVHNTYNEKVVNNVTINNRTSYNGGSDGVVAAPTARERSAAHEPHIAPTVAQTAHVQEASRTPALAAKANGGHPAIAATARPGAFAGPGVVGARGAENREAGAREEPRKEPGADKAASGAREPVEAPHVAATRNEHETPRTEAARTPEAREKAPESARAPPEHRESPTAPAAAASHPEKVAHNVKPKPVARHEEKKPEPNGDRK